MPTPADDLLPAQPAFQSFVRGLRELFADDAWDQLEPYAERVWEAVQPIDDVSWSRIRHYVRAAWSQPPPSV